MAKHLALHLSIGSVSGMDLGQQNTIVCVRVVENIGVIWYMFNTLRPRQNGRHFADDIFKWVILNENVKFPIKISL